jgi:hypothetical protein
VSSVVYLSGWEPNLCVQLDTENKNLADFNRLLAKGFPSTERLQQESQFEDANRKVFILQLKDKFNEAMDEGSSHRTLYNIFNSASLYFQWCDKDNLSPFSQDSLERYMTYQQNLVMLGEIKRSTYRKKRSQMVTLFTHYLDLPHSFFHNVAIMDKSDEEHFEAYTRSDLNQLLPFLRSLFNQTYQQFIENPLRHINAYKSTNTMIFQWQSNTYLLCGGISKMMSAATYLLAYYTYSNTSDLFQLKQPKNSSTSVGDTWYTMPAFKRRAFKTIQVEMGTHTLEIPKYAATFFDKLLNASRLISTSDNATLLQTIASKNVTPLSSSKLQSFCNKWLEKHLNFKDQTGNRLRPVVSRFRETGSQLTAYHQGEMVNDIMLNNTPRTRKKHYSQGNRLTNNGMMQDTMSIKEEQVKSGVNSEQARKNLNIDVLVIEAENTINFPELTRTASGGSCATPFGEKSKRYTKKAQKQGLAKEGERLACADLLGCFGCPDQVVVQSVSDIWCLLSFKACIEESLYLHLDASHYRDNFLNIIEFIDQKILPNIGKGILKEAESKLDNDGYHPLWSDSESLLELIPKQKVKCINEHI